MDLRAHKCFWNAPPPPPSPLVVSLALGNPIITQNQAVTNHNKTIERVNGRHFPNDIFKWIFLNENVMISINISLNFIPMGQIKNIPTLVQVMAWRRPGDKPLSKKMMVRLPTHICVTRPQWVKRMYNSHVVCEKCYIPFEFDRAVK